jgi:probable O-glycosylation ligase (exosortase A-associated)
MKQLIFMILATLCGTVGVFFVSPFWGVFVYYLFAVLRPQYLWQWALPDRVPWSLFVALATIAGAAGCSLGVLKLDPQSDESQRRPHHWCWAHYAVFAFAFWMVVSFVTARNRDASWFYVVEYCKIFLMYAVAAYLIRAERQIWALYVMALVALCYIAYEVNFLYFFYTYLGIYRNGYGGFDNNGAALMLALAVPLCWFAFEGTTRWWRWCYVLLIPIVIHAVLMTYSRGAMLSLIVISPWIWWRSRQKTLLGIAGASFALIALPILAGPEIKARFMSIEQNEVDESANSRRAAWRAAWKMAQENPIFGVGLRNSNLYSYAYGADIPGRTIHNQYLQILADTGFPGLAMYLLLLLAAIFSLHRCRRYFRHRTDVDGRRNLAITNGLECTVLLFMFGSLFLSLELFEILYLVHLLAVQLAIVSGAWSVREVQSIGGPLVDSVQRPWLAGGPQPLLDGNYQCPASSRTA